MVVVSFDPSQHNFIRAGEDSYFLLLLPDGSPVMLHDRCLHRGGPLHLGEWDEGRGCLVCPWHQTRYPEKTIKKRAIPMVYRDTRATIVLDVPPDTVIQLLKKTILAMPCREVS